MNLAPYIQTFLQFIETYWLSLLLGLSGWFLISCVCFWWGAMVKRAEPKIIHDNQAERDSNLNNTHIG